MGLFVILERKLIKLISRPLMYAHNKINVPCLDLKMWKSDVSINMVN